MRLKLTVKAPRSCCSFSYKFLKCSNDIMIVLMTSCVFRTPLDTPVWSCDLYAALASRCILCISCWSFCSAVYVKESVNGKWNQDQSHHNFMPKSPAIITYLHYHCMLLIIFALHITWNQLNVHSRVSCILNSPSSLGGCINPCIILGIIILYSCSVHVRVIIWFNWIAVSSAALPKINVMPVVMQP